MNRAQRQFSLYFPLHQMSYADVVLYDVLGRMTDADDAVFSKFEAVAPDNGRMVWALDGDAYPKVKAMLEAVGENEGIKKYLESRDTERERQRERRF